MPSERENSTQILTPVNYDVAGNVFRAYFDARHKLVFVIDYTVSDRKPNVMLVINAVGNRKWDDVLANDYGIDLETVRPKKDNKYQKLDIEYTGLDVYGDLIEKFESGSDVSGAIDALNGFRISSARRAASERLAAADITAENARETILKTNETLDELAARVKALRAKLSRQRKEVGREPTKQSAAKILRTEAQIDATNEKTRRAKKRLASAQRRLVAAEEDAEIARGILNMDSALPAAPTAPALSGPDAFPNRPDTAIATTHDALPAEVVPQFTEMVPFDAENENIKPTTETKAEIMADEEVKPLFDKDPEILDEEIAFKPIEFNVPDVVSAPTAARAADEYSDGGVVSPLSFVPPTATQTPAHAETAPINVTPVTENSAPVLDTITSVEMPDATETIITETPVIAPAPVTDNTAATQPVAPAPMPEIAPAPMSSDFRPVSPITGGATPTAPARQKPTLMYYIMLVLLIALSIFTLWIYQKSASDNVPDLTTTTAASADKNAKPQPVAAQMPQIDENASNSPFVDVTADVVETVEITPQTTQSAPVEPDIVVPVTPEPVDVPATAPMPEPEAEPVPVTPDIEPVPAESEFVDVEADIEVPPEPKSAPVETPFLSEPVPEPEPVVNKPAYNVSQQENMFVASLDYETDADEYMQTETFGYEDDGVTCSDGRAPDAFGCCSGEVFTDMGDGTAACCSGNECFPPMF